MCPKQYLISGGISLTLISDQQVASCTFYQFGAAGRQVGLNALCILTLTILVDKVGIALSVKKEGRQIQRDC